MTATKIRKREELKEPMTKDFISLINANDRKKCANICPKSKKGKAFDLNKKPPEKDCDVASSSNHRESNKVELPLSKDNLDLTLRLCSVHALPWSTSCKSTWPNLWGFRMIFFQYSSNGSKHIQLSEILFQLLIIIDFKL